jgi:hypothetical protein
VCWLGNFIVTAKSSAKSQRKSLARFCHYAMRIDCCEPLDALLHPWIAAVDENAFRTQALAQGHQRRY